MENLIRTQIPISQLKQGMTVEYRGKLLTVSKNDVKYNSLFGYSFRGDGSKQEIVQIQFSVPILSGTSII